MRKIIQYADGRITTMQRFKEDNPRVMFSGATPPETAVRAAGAVFITVPTYATLAEAKRAMVEWIDQLTNQLTWEYPEAVQKGWEEEEATAAAYLAGTEDPTQLQNLTADANAKSRTLTEHATIVLGKAQAFRAIAGLTRSLWLASEKALEQVVDPNDYETVLKSAIAQAALVAGAYGLKV